MKKLLLTSKEILFDESPVILKSLPDENWEKDWMPLSGEWKYEDGALIGIERGNKGGILFSRQNFDEPVMMTCKISTILPASRDVNCVFNGHWNEETDYIGDSYLAGLNGWWDNLAGMERCWKWDALIPSFKYTAGEEIEMTVGSIKGHCFMFVNDQLVMEYCDHNDPILDGHVGFSAYCTMLKIRDIEVRKIKYNKRARKYDPEF